jgi:hypothetical protein
MYLRDGSKEGAKKLGKDAGDVNNDEKRLNLGVMDITDQPNSRAMDIIH